MVLGIRTNKGLFFLETTNSRCSLCSLAEESSEHTPHQCPDQPENENGMTFGLADCRLHVKRQGTVDYVQSNTVKKTYQLRGKIWVAWHMRINILLHRSCNLSQKHAKLKHTLSFLKKAKSIRIE